jgi:pseudouridylate synthase / pseudouridine kinase
MDVSADLTELGRTPIALVSSGCKSFLDIPRTLEYLETQGVGVGTFADGREGPVKFPAFWTRESDFASPNIIKDEKKAAAILHAQLKLPLQSGLLFANPIPAEHSLPKDMVDQITTQAINEAAEKGHKGSANTPYILSRIRELTNGGTVTANRSLVEANIIRGTKVAVELAKLASPV